MSNKVRTQIILLLLIYLGCVHCKKASDQFAYKLPPITQTGANTFGCLINGKVWTPLGSVFKPNLKAEVDPGFQGGSILINAHRVEGGYYSGIVLSLDTAKATGTYIIDDHRPGAFWFTKLSPDLTIEYCDVGTGLHPTKGFVKVTRYDLSAKIIAGTFEVQIVSNTCGFGDTLNITDGRFDIQFY